MLRTGFDATRTVARAAGKQRREAKAGRQVATLVSPIVECSSIQVHEYAHELRLCGSALHEVWRWRYCETVALATARDHPGDLSLACATSIPSFVLVRLLQALVTAFTLKPSAKTETVGWLVWVTKAWLGIDSRLVGEADMRNVPAQGWGGSLISGGVIKI